VRSQSKFPFCARCHTLIALLGANQREPVAGSFTKKPCDKQSHLRDLIGAIDDIQQFTKGMDTAAFCDPELVMERLQHALADVVDKLFTHRQDHPSR
jgi:hypothetical protein